MADLNSSIEYIFTMTDNVSATTDTISDSATEATNALHKVETQEASVKASTEETTAALTKQQAQFLTNMTILTTMQSSVSAVTSSLITMGVVTGDDATKLQTLVAGFQLLTGMAQGIQALQAVSEALKASEMGLAVVETFRSVMQSPWKAALVGIGAGAAVGAATALMTTSGSSGSSTSSNTIIIENTASNIQTASGINATISGGRIL